MYSLKSQVTFPKVLPLGSLPTGTQYTATERKVTSKTQKEITVLGTQ